MSIETNLKSIAESLATIAACMPLSDPAPAADPSIVPASPATAPVTPPPVVETPVVTPPPAAVTPPPVQTPPPAATPTMTPEELNAALVVEAGRIGNPDLIRSEMAKLGASSVNQLQPEQYSVLVAAVKLSPAPVPTA